MLGPGGLSITGSLRFRAAPADVYKRQVLGRRQGLCPLYPLACALLYLPTVFLLYNYTALYHCGVLFLAALAGNALGALWGRPRKEETP